MISESKYLDLREKALREYLRVVDFAEPEYKTVFVVSKSVMEAMTCYEVASPPSHGIIIRYDKDKPYTAKFHGVDVVLCSNIDSAFEYVDKDMFTSGFIIDGVLFLPTEEQDLWLTLDIVEYCKKNHWDLEPTYILSSNVTSIGTVEDDLKQGDTTALDDYLHSFERKRCINGRP